MSKSNHPDPGQKVALRAVLSIAAAGTGIASILIAGGTAGTDNGTIRLGLLLFTALAAAGFLVGAMYVWLHSPPRGQVPPAPAGSQAEPHRRAP